MYCDLTKRISLTEMSDRKTTRAKLSEETENFTVLSRKLFILKSLNPDGSYTVKNSLKPPASHQLSFVNLSL